MRGRGSAEAELSGAWYARPFFFGFDRAVGKMPSRQEGCSVEVESAPPTRAKVTAFGAARPSPPADAPFERSSGR